MNGIAVFMHTILKSRLVYRSIIFMLILTLLPVYAHGDETVDPSGFTGFAPLPAPEHALLSDTFLDDGSWLAKALALSGSSLGLVTSAWGLRTMAQSISKAEGVESLHQGLAITISGTVLAALSSAVYSLFTASVNQTSVK